MTLRISTAILISAASLFSVTAEQAQSAVLFEFTDGSEFDGSAAADGSVSMTRQDDTTFEELVLTSEGALGVDGLSDGHTTNIFANVDSLGINDSNFNNASINNESRDFQPNEAWIISFDKPVTITEIDFASIGDGLEVTLSSSAFDDIVVTVDNTDSGGVFAPVGGLTIPANTPFQFQNTTDPSADDTAFRISSLTATIVPEPSSLLLAASSLALVVARRRQVA